jgi:NodT family efflux transporter outer membrane factor (OMF) lipoprotein
MPRNAASRGLGPLKAARSLLLVGPVALSACSLAPPYQEPPAPQIAGYKETGLWTEAQPADQIPHGAWWEVFGDDVLNGLERQVDAANPTLAEALARYDVANALAQEAAAGLLPAAQASGAAAGNRQSNNRPLRGANQPDQYAANTVGVNVAWELDLWGRVRSAVAAQRASAQAAAADLASAKLSLEADLADDYMQLRGLDNQAALLTEVAQGYARSLALTQKLHADGLASRIDIDRAEALLQTARAQLSEAQSRRALLEHAIASLAGQPASTFALAAKAGPLAMPNVPPAIPSVLLQRRPDVAAAERRMAAANASIGVARAAFYPTLDLTGQAGYQNTGGANLLTAPNSFWSFGPALALTLFDGGLRRAALSAARAEFQATSAAYRGQVLEAFQEVEDGLALENRLAEEAVSQNAAIAAAEGAESLAVRRYQRGVSSYLDVVVAQTTALQAQEAGYDLAARRAQASVRLIRAIGGGWTGADPAIQAKTAAMPLAAAAPPAPRS